jgi:succinate dehydrogenase/fumarate reductase-like Fe-S protein
MVEKKHKKKNCYQVKVFRYDPLKDKAARYETYDVPIKEGMTILGALTYIYENIDSSLSYSYSCRWGQCKACIANVDERPAKICLKKLTKDVKIEPLPGYNILKDLTILDKK